MDLSEFTHAGWIPTLSGQLFLDQVACQLSKKETRVELNVLLQHNHEVLRLLASSSTVNWRDYGVPRSQGEFGVVFTSIVPRLDSNICGWICLFPLPNQNNRKFDEFQDQLRELANRKDEEIEDEKFLNQFKSFHKDLSRGDFGSDRHSRIKFKIHRSGVVAFRSEQPDDEDRLYIRQAFYYLKYAFHRHQHHRFEDDSITTIHNIPDEPKELGALLVKDLKEAVGAIRRSHHPSNLSDILSAKGVCAYAQSLITTCERFSLLSPNEATFERDYVENMLRSIDVMVENYRTKIDRSAAAGNYVRSIALFVLAVMAPITLVNRQSISDRLPDNSLYVEMAVRIFGTSDGFYVFLLLFGAGFVTWAVRYRYGTALLGIDLFRRFISKIVHDRFKGYILSAIILLVGALLIGLVVYRVFF